MSRNGPIVCVEDDEDDQFLINQATIDLAITNEMHFFSNGKEALDYLITTEEKPLLILSDINMPCMNGIELRRHIVESDYLRKKSIPFVYFSTAANPKLVDEAYQTMVQGFYQKASQYDKLQEQIEIIVRYWQHCLHPNNQE